MNAHRKRCTVKNGNLVSRIGELRIGNVICEVNCTVVNVSRKCLYSSQCQELICMAPFAT